jgi:hypothetical protein
MGPKPKGRKVNDAREAEQLLAAWSASGQPMAAWCEQRGLNWYSLAGYKGWPKRAAPAFVEVHTAPPLPPPDPCALYRIRVGPFLVETEPSFDEDSLRRLLKLVATC